ncbi:Zinc-binding ribosomal protein [Parasponia andersonii]|uniref:Large ribosomal subunit protein bL32m n=1 Tax=Parasponia andersonii TaxID=3476 RepID=A0A2P5BZE3_PARAD|nr:Zinc-binding ribosomal protein [Parasponia andersonii]
MALRMLTLKSGGGKMTSLLGLRWTHGAAIPGPLDGLVERNMVSPPLVLPEFDRAPPEDSNNNWINGFGFPSFSFGGSMELMAVPKRKVSPHKRGIRNGPKALKPTPVIMRCRIDFQPLVCLCLWDFEILDKRSLNCGERSERSCGRVKLPHFYCCSGEREGTGEKNGSTR